MGDGGEVRWGSESMRVVSLPPHSKRRICVQCEHLFCLAKKTPKKQKTPKKMERFTLTELYQACCYTAYSLILQLIQFLDNPLSHQIQNTVKLTFSLHSHTTTRPMHRRTDANLYPPERQLTKASEPSFDLEGGAKGQI